MKRVCARNQRAAALWLLIEADQSYIPSWHFKYDIVLLCVLIGKESNRDRVRRKKRKSKAERHSSKLHNAKYINISIWCLILPPSLLTPLASVAPSPGLNGPFQDKVMLLACVVNLPPEPKGACGGLAHGHAGRVAVVTL